MREPWQQLEAKLLRLELLPCWLVLIRCRQSRLVWLMPAFLTTTGMSIVGWSSGREGGKKTWRSMTALRYLAEMAVGRRVGNYKNGFEFLIRATGQWNDLQIRVSSPLLTVFGQ